MKLHAPQFEQALARTIKQRIKASPELRKEAKRSGTASRPWDTGFLVYHAMSMVMLPLGIVAMGQSGKSLGFQTAVISLWCFMLSLFHISRLFQCLFGSADLPALSLLPIADRTIFDWQWQKVLRHSLWIPAHAFAAYLAVVWQKELGWPGVMAAFIATMAQWLICVSLATGLAGYRPQWPHQLIGMGVFFLLVVPFVARKILPAEIFVWVDAKAWIVNLVLPNGWITQLFNQCVTGFNAAMWLLLVAMFAIIQFGRTGRELLVSFYVFTDLPDTTPELEDELQSPEMEEPPPANDQPTKANPLSQRQGITDHLDHIRSPDFLQAQPLSAAGWIERLFKKWLTAREALLVEAFVGELPRWTGRWRKTVIFCGISLAIAVSLPYSKREASHLIYLFAGVFAFLFSTPAGGDFRRFFGGYEIGTIQVPFMAGFPISSREIWRIFNKAACVRALAAMPLFMIFAALALHFSLANDTKRAFLYGMFLGFKLSLVGIILQPALYMNWLSRATKHRQSHFFWRTGIMFLLFLLSILTILLLVIGLFLPYWWSIFFLALTWLCTWGLSEVYIYLFNRHKVDFVMSRATSENDVL